MMSFLADFDTSNSPLSEQLHRAASQLSAMHTVGELDALSPNTRLELAGLALFLDGAGDRARELEYAATLRRVRPEPVGSVVRRILKAFPR